MIYSILVILFCLAILLWLRELSKNAEIKGILRTGLREAESYKPGGRDHIRIPYTQAAHLIGWVSDLPVYEPPKSQWSHARRPLRRQKRSK
jgi:hypothetical protein